MPSNYCKQGKTRQQSVPVHQNLAGILEAAASLLCSKHLLLPTMSKSKEMQMLVHFLPELRMRLTGICYPEGTLRRECSSDLLEGSQIVYWPSECMSQCDTRSPGSTAEILHQSHHENHVAGIAFSLSSLWEHARPALVRLCSNHHAFISHHIGRVLCKGQLSGGCAMHVWSLGHACLRLEA